MPQWIGDFYQLFLMGSRNNDELLVSHILFAEDTFIFFVRLIMNNSVICIVFSYVLKWFRGCRLTYLNQRWFQLEMWTM